MSPRNRRLPRRGLVVREPYASWIVEGRKSWELRKQRTKLREPIGIITGGELIGEATIEDVAGPFTLEELEEHADRHLGDPKFLDKYAGDRRLWAWILTNPKRYARPVPVPSRPGRMLWADISELSGDVSGEVSDQAEP